MVGADEDVQRWRAALRTCGPPGHSHSVFVLYTTTWADRGAGGPRGLMASADKAKKQKDGKKTSSESESETHPCFHCQTEGAKLRCKMSVNHCLQ